MSRNLRIALAVIPLSLVLACADAAKAPAEAAMAAATAALESVKGDAARYAPDVVQAAQASLAKAKELAAKQDFKGALAAAGEVPAKVKEAFATAAARKEQLMAAYKVLVSNYDQAVAALKDRVAQLSASKKLPRGVGKDAVDAARQGIDRLARDWESAAELAKSGDYATAITEGMKVKVKAEGLVKSLAGK
ncbi:MAG: hypothetical protein WCK73_00085 [Deltaproteobacteria bacterium]